LLGCVAAVFDVEQAWWFGSRARGEGREDSDFDLLVVAPTDLDRFSRMSLALKATRGIGVERDIFVATPAEFEAGRLRCGSIIFSAVRDGRAIHV